MCSDVTSGILEKKTLLNPSKVDEVIESWNITDYSDPENQKASFSFEDESIDPNVSEEDQFKILGTKCRRSHCIYSWINISSWLYDKM